MIIQKAALYITAADISGIPDDVIFKIITEPAFADGQYGKKLECKITVKVGTKNLPDSFKWTINDRARNVLFDKYGEEKRKWVLTENIVFPEKKAILIIPDKKG